MDTDTNTDDLIRAARLAREDARLARAEVAALLAERQALRARLRESVSEAREARRGHAKS